MLSKEEFEEGLRLAIEGIKIIYRKQKEALKEKYRSIVGEVYEERE